MTSKKHEIVLKTVEETCNNMIVNKHENKLLTTRS